MMLTYAHPHVYYPKSSEKASMLINRTLILERDFDKFV